MRNPFKKKVDTDDPLLLVKDVLADLLDTQKQETSFLADQGVHTRGVAMQRFTFDVTMAQARLAAHQVYVVSSLVRSSKQLERLTWWLIFLTAVLVVATVILLYATLLLLGRTPN